MTINGKQYKVLAQAIHDEASPVIPQERPAHLYNMLIFIIYDVELNEKVL
jgi:hypothetical protein